jgi:glycosyltransferase involved in cell wall biosynthesis
MQEFKVSLIVPVYNVEKYLRKCLDSAINQTLNEIEIIVINDGSTDNSLSIINEYKSMDERIKVITQKNCGVSEARNVGIRAAKGKYVAFLDSDDWVDVHFLEKMYNEAKHKDADIVICNFVNVFEGIGKFHSIKHFKFNLLSCDQALRKIISDSSLRSYTWDKLYKRILFTDNNIYYPCGMYFEDLATTFKLIYYSKKIAVINEYLYNYLQRKGSITKKVNEKSILDNIKAIAIMRKFLEEKECFTRFKREYQYLCLKMIIYMMFNLLMVYDKNSKLNRYKIFQRGMKEINVLMTIKNKKEICKII